ncbi:MAG: hypothetical protein ACR2NM_17105 [Bythopirellula sp.]
MSLRNRSSQWILGIVCCSLLLNSASLGWGQEYLDLPDEPQGGRPRSLTEKIFSLKDRFKRDNTSTNRQSTSRSQPSYPRYRSKSAANAQKKRSTTARKSPPAVTSGTPQAVASRTSKSVASGTPKSIISGIVSRPRSNDLLPDTKLFSRSTQPSLQPPKRVAQQLTRATDLPRAGTARAKQSASKSPQTKITRKSPPTSRANELDAALADLVKTQPVPQSKPAAIKSTKPAQRKPAQRKPAQRKLAQRKPARSNVAKQTPNAKSAVASNTFDLRKALLDDEADIIAADVAKALAGDEVAAVKAPTKAPKPADKVDTEVVNSEPKREEKPPVATAQPDVTAKVSPPVVAEAAKVKAAPRQAITIAKPESAPPVTAGPRTVVPSSPTVGDPFESTAKQVFSTPQQTTNPMRAYQATVDAEQPANTIGRPSSGVLQTTQQPVIVSHVEGPRSILVGREATYQVTLENTSDTPALDLSAEINVPEWAELVDAMSTSGIVERSSQGANAGVLAWKLTDLAPRSSQALRVRLIPRSGRPLQLGVRWTQAPVVTQAVVEVQEPKLNLAISGPHEVRYGKPQRYRLTLSNPGTGTTEQVALRLIPPGGDVSTATTQKVGNLKPGEVRDIDLELTAREAGQLLIQADAIAEGGLKAETTKSVLCLKPELKVDWRGPDKKYAGTIAAYYFRVQNPGTAATEPVNMNVKLPIGAEFVSASEGYSINTATGVVSWRLASIDVKEEQFMQLRCKIARPGRNDFEVIAKTTDGELSENAAFQTNVIALADLKLEVSDPQGPLPLGDTVAYEIRVKNRGTTNAENINIVGLFSEGIDPNTVEGAQFSIRDGRVSFHPIKSLPAGREIVLRINAQASQVGTHIFRTEVTCPKLDIKLAAEETTRFFQDEHRWEDGQTPYTAERDSATTTR